MPTCCLYCSWVSAGCRLWALEMGSYACAYATCTFLHKDSLTPTHTCRPTDTVFPQIVSAELHVCACFDQTNTPTHRHYLPEHRIFNISINQACIERGWDALGPPYLQCFFCMFQLQGTLWGPCFSTSKVLRCFRGCHLKGRLSDATSPH